MRERWSANRVCRRGLRWPCGRGRHSNRHFSWGPFLMKVGTSGMGWIRPHREASKRRCRWSGVAAQDVSPALVFASDAEARFGQELGELHEEPVNHGYLFEVQEVCRRSTVRSGYEAAPS
jgi:hypothetical protein